MSEVKVESDFSQHIIQDETGHWYWSGSVTQNGVAYLWTNNHPTTIYRLAWMKLNGDIPAGFTLRRTCDDSKCINPEHRELICTKEQNRGIRHGKSRLTEDIILDIRERFNRGERQTALAQAYGVSQPQISFIIRGKAWSHVK